MHDYYLSLHPAEKKILKLAADYPALVLFDNFSGQCNEKILKLLDVNNINCVMIPANSTDLLQPMNLSVYKCVKDYLRKQFQECYADEILVQKTSENEMVPWIFA